MTSGMLTYKLRAPVAQTWEPLEYKDGVGQALATTAMRAPVVLHNEELGRQIRLMTAVQRDPDVPVPTTFAVDAANSALSHATSVGLWVDQAITSIEGGILLSFFAPNRKSYLEFYNDGEVVYGVDATGDVPRAFPVSQDLGDLASILGAISVAHAR